MKFLGSKIEEDVIPILRTTSNLEEAMQIIDSIKLHEKDEPAESAIKALINRINDVIYENSKVLNKIEKIMQDFEEVERKNRSLLLFSAYEGGNLWARYHTINGDYISFNMTSLSKKDGVEELDENIIDAYMTLLRFYGLIDNQEISIRHITGIDGGGLTAVDYCELSDGTKIGIYGYSPMIGLVGDVGDNSFLDDVVGIKVLNIDGTEMSIVRQVQVYGNATTGEKFDLAVHPVSIYHTGANIYTNGWGGSYGGNQMVFDWWTEDYIFDPYIREIIERSGYMGMSDKNTIFYDNGGTFESRAGKKSSIAQFMGVSRKICVR